MGCLMLKGLGLHLMALRKQPLTLDSIPCQVASMPLGWKGGRRGGAQVSSPWHLDRDSFRDGFICLGSPSAHPLIVPTGPQEPTRAAAGDSGSHNEQSGIMVQGRAQHSITLLAKGSTASHSLPRVVQHHTPCQG